MEWSRDNNNGYDDMGVYMKNGYVFVSTAGRNHAKMACSLFNFTHTNAMLALSNWF